MTDPTNVESAAGRVEQAKRLIQEACLARLKAEPSVRAMSTQDAIDRTRNASEAAASLARLIDSLDRDPENAPLRS